MKLVPLVTPIFRPGSSIKRFISKVLEKNKNHLSFEGSILAVTSKIVSLSENRIESIKKWKNKEKLIKKESDYYLEKTAYNTHLTIKENLFIPSAGVDTSNAQGEFYILYPKNPYKSAQLLFIFLKRHFGLKNFGVLITDSRTLPLRRGVTGVALSYWGFRGLRNLVGKKDLFGKTLRFTSINVADALATSATLLMGEGNNKTPLALINEAPVDFIKNENDTDKENLVIEPKDDLYYSLYKDFIKKN